MNIFGLGLFLFLLSSQAKIIESTEDTPEDPFVLYTKEKISPNLWKIIIDRINHLQNYTEFFYPDYFKVCIFLSES